MPDLRFVEAAMDPNLIAGIYNGCDQWCHYCPATDKCLAFRLSEQKAGRNIYGDIRDAMRESIIALKESHETQGRQPPGELLQLIEDSGKPVILEPVNDPLERLGRRYAIVATTYIASGEPLPDEIPKRPHGPTPQEVFQYYHFQIATKIYRAIISARRAASKGDGDLQGDANLTAKVALLGIDRSDEALQVLALDDPDVRIGHLRRLLRQLRQDIEIRFPDARRTVRPGFDPETVSP